MREWANYCLIEQLKQHVKKKLTCTYVSYF